MAEEKRPVLSLKRKP
ncbi:TPA: hypothetical protein ME644_005547, partial [Klebsiella pneumoniae]|nr:hypothetical protein [Klebsiella pneumoniae]HBT9013712.1 hypothetical protein [Klebsiella pneumoniae]HBU4975098.1 hypothetical protein [Klebsiella pneumoniae]HBW4835395.1 hypothetical protein [Klebsiella pneumoniae]HBW4873112.1 hypothetical protein [Klebsiella pneumoniae]